MNIETLDVQPNESPVLTHNNYLKMQFLIVLIIAIVASASAFAPRSFARASNVKTMVRLLTAQLQVMRSIAEYVSYTSRIPQQMPKL